MAYNIAYTKKLASKNANVITKKMAKNVAATKSGFFNTFCNTIANITVATGKAKNINKVFICFSPILFIFSICYILCHFSLFCYILSFSF